MCTKGVCCSVELFWKNSCIMHTRLKGKILSAFPIDPCMTMQLMISFTPAGYNHYFDGNGK